MFPFVAPLRTLCVVHHQKWEDIPVGPEKDDDYHSLLAYEFT